VVLPQFLRSASADIKGLPSPTTEGAILTCFSVHSQSDLLMDSPAKYSQAMGGEKGKEIEVKTEETAGNRLEVCGTIRAM
jgi:hypothetical protein